MLDASLGLFDGAALDGHDDVAGAAAEGFDDAGPVEDAVAAGAAHRRAGHLASLGVGMLDGDVFGVQVDQAVDDAPAQAPADAVAFLQDATHDADNPVVLFALEWCEFCWSVRKMFAEYEIPYRSIDLDSVEYQKDNKGGEIRAALLERTGLKTIPQIYIGGEHVGGATELFDACSPSPATTPPATAISASGISRSRSMKAGCIRRSGATYSRSSSPPCNN